MKITANSGSLDKLPLDTHQLTCTLLVISMLELYIGGLYRIDLQRSICTASPVSMLIVFKEKIRGSIYTQKKGKMHFPLFILT